MKFPSTVSGVTRETTAAAVDLLDEPLWGGVKPAPVVPAEFREAVEPAGWCGQGIAS